MVTLLNIFLAVGIIVLEFYFCMGAVVGNSSGCIVQNYKTVRCTQDFNLTHFIVNYNSSDGWDIWTLEILDTDLQSIDKASGFTFQKPFLFERIYIQNAPNLSSVDAGTISVLSKSLIRFRAIGTKLPDYNDLGRRVGDEPNPFADFSKLGELYVGHTEGACPVDPTVLSPCSCEHGKLWLRQASSLYSTSSSRYDGYGNLTGINCDDNSITGEGLGAIFQKLTSSAHTPRHFDFITFRSTNLTHLPKNVFSDSSFTAVWFDSVSNLRSIHPGAFVIGGGGIQMLQIDGANFTAADDKEVANFFTSLHALPNIRMLRLWNCGIPFVPNSAFVPGQDHKFHNLRYLSISFDRRVHPSGLSWIGSYAFSGAPKLREIGIGKNFISKFESFSFAFNETRRQSLVVEIGRNPFNDSAGLEPNAFSGSRGPLHIKYEIDSFASSDPANDPRFDYLPESVFRPFLKENPENFLEVDYYNVEIWCDSGSQWMFDNNGLLKSRVQNGIRIKRLENNVVSSTPDSFRCKAGSSFQALPPCLIFPIPGLVHCGGNSESDVTKTFEHLEGLNLTGNFTKLIFSTRRVEEILPNSFTNFEFTHIHFFGAQDLRRIHPGAFGASAATIQEFEAAETSLKSYPNFGAFPNLQRVKLDDSQPFNLTKASFDFTEHRDSTKGQRIDIYLSNGTIEPLTFEAFRNASEVVASLHIGIRKECDTIACGFSCTPAGLELIESVFRPFLDATPWNQIHVTCYLECSCQLKWLFQNWNVYNPQVHLWLGGNSFYCVPPGESIQDPTSFWGIDPTKFNTGEYFTKNC